MAEPLSYRILLDLQEALRGIFAGGGYFFTVAPESVSVDPLDALAVVTGASSPSPFFVVYMLALGRPEYHPANRIREFLPVSIIAFANAEANNPTSWVKTCERLVADIEKAILVDHTRGGLAGDTRITGRLMRPVTGSLRVEVVVQLEIRMYRFYGSPNG